MFDQPHDSWAEVYDEEYTQSFGALYDMLTNKTIEVIRENTESGKDVLDIGAGTGRISLPLVRDGYSVCAVDSSTKMLNVLKRKDSEDLIRTVNSPVQELELNQTFDTVICVFSVFCYLTNKPDLSASIRTIVRHTNETGYALIDIPNIFSFSGLNYESNTLSRQVTVTELDPETGLFKYSENIKANDGMQDLYYQDSFQIKYWAVEDILDEFEKAGMIVNEYLSERFIGSGADYFTLVKG